jgi:peroxiredoxin
MRAAGMAEEIMEDRNMAALTPGTTAPDFKLSTMDGKPFSLREALARGPVVAAFFKISCPVCQYAFPFLERIYRTYSDKNVALVGISQNDRQDTAAFVKEYGVSFPVLLDDTRAFPVSNAYGLTNVPTIFWIAQDGEIEVSSVGWSRQDIEEINGRAARSAGDGHTPVFQPHETVSDFLAG